MANPALIAFVREVNEAVASVLNANSKDILDEYVNAGGRAELKPMPEVLDNADAFTALIHLLQSARMQEVAKKAKPEPQERNLKWAAEGVVKATKALALPETEESKARLAICESCDQWTGRSCKICGCFVKLKVKIPEEKCPAGKW